MCRHSPEVFTGSHHPAGSDFEYYKHVRIPHDEPPPPPAPSPEELEREMEYLVEAEDNFGRDEVAE